MNVELLTFLFGSLGTLIGAGISWGVTKVKIENLLRDMIHIQTWKEAHENWSNTQNTMIIERLTENRMNIDELRRLIDGMEKRRINA